MLKLRGIHFNGFYYHINRNKCINTLIISVLAGPDDGIDFYLISQPFLHVFDQTMSMLPFVTRTDMFEVIKKADARASYVDPLCLPSTMELERWLS